MSCQSKRYELLIADKSYNSEIQNIFDSTSFPGNISVKFSRGKKPLESLKNDGEEIFPLIIKDKEKNKVIAFGCCVIQRLFINGKERNVGYLTGLKLLPEYQRKIRILPLAYKFLYDNLKSKVDVFYTTILSENYKAQKTLEKKRKSMPMYNYIDDYTVRCFKYKKTIIPNVRRGDVKGLEEFYNESLPKFNFSPVNRRLHNLCSNDFFTMRSGYGNIVMACAVWNQQDYKQYIIDGYNGIFKIIKHFPSELLGFPSFPKTKSPINYGTVSLLCADEEYANKIPEFLATVSSMTKYSFLISGILKSHPFYEYVKKLKSIKYSSKLYTVDWQEQFDLDNKPIQLEVGLL